MTGTYLMIQSRFTLMMGSNYIPIISTIKGWHAKAVSIIMSTNYPMAVGIYVARVKPHVR